MCNFADKRYKDGDPMPGPSYLALIRDIKRDYERKWTQFNWSAGMQAEAYNFLFGENPPNLKLQTLKTGENEVTSPGGKLLDTTGSGQ